ncbi:MAG: ribonuclease R [Pseudomonadota bacterium]
MKRRPADPYAQREARRYERPIPSRELILQIMLEEQRPLVFDELAELLKVEQDVDLESLRRRLRAMGRDGQIVRNRRGGYLSADPQDLIRGRVVGHADGFGFLVPDEGGEDLFLSARQMRSLLHGDRALARVIGVDRRGRREGALVEVLERNNEQVVGRFFTERGLGFVVPDNKRIHQDILIPPEHIGKTHPEQIVIAAIMKQPSAHSQPIGKIVEVLGDRMAPGMEIDIALRAHELPHQWPDEVSLEVSRLPSEVSKKAKRDRVDLRDIPLVTIDGEDARDFDDAVYCERRGKDWRLMVAIADVSAYVKPDTALDREAYTRGTSVYFPGRVIPMLPEILSNGLCSLNPEVDRLCMVCDMHIGARGRLKAYEFYPALMRSKARLTYDEVAAMVVDKDKLMRHKYKHLVPHLKDLYTLYKALHKQRIRRGAIDFDTTETRIVFGPDKKIEKILPTQRNDAHRLIEECMIAANVCAARFIKKSRMPGLYRIHDGPAEDRLQELREFLAEFALSLGGGDRPTPKDYARLVASIGERPDAHLIQTVLLRSLSQAVYSPQNTGHFGLAHDKYTHFTSPIRRYPDLLVHRAIRHVLNGGKTANFDYSNSTMMSMGEHCSMTERRADEATRGAVLWLKCEYMQDHLGKEFEGVISAVTSFGLFVELSEVYVDGLIHITSLEKDYFHFDPVGHRLTGKRTGRVYRLGDMLKVVVSRVDLDERKIDLNLADWPPDKSPRRGYLRKRRERKR